MTSPFQFISGLKQRGIQLRVQEGSLRIRSSAGAIDPGVVDEITARKEELMEFLKKATDPPAIQAIRIPSVPRRPELPLSSGQRRLWFADCLVPNSATYSMPYAYQVCGPFDRNLLEEALTEIVRRHEILRTRFGSREAEPFQTVLAPRPVTVTYLDFASLGEEEKQRKIDAVCENESKTPFCLEEPPLFRVTLIAQAPESYVVLFTIHHIISDGWSMDVLKRELSIVYAAFAEGKPSPLPELPLQYADYASWQSGIDYKAGREKARLDYWRRTLAGAPALLDLPTNRPRTDQRTPLGWSVPVNLSPQLSERLAALGQGERCSLFMTSLAMFAVLLFRYSGEEDICIGAPVAGRVAGELEKLIGFFVNSLVFRLNLGGRLSTRMLLNQVREHVLQALEYQDVPFERIVEELNPERTPAYSPLFQVAFAFRKDARLTGDATDTYIREIPAAGTGTAMFDITLHLAENGGLLSGWLEYSCDLFDREMMEQMVAHYVNLLNAACDDPDGFIGTLPILSTAERKKIVEEWNETAAPFEAKVCIHDLFTRQASRTPDAIAVTDLKSTLTYAELDRYSNQIAHMLRERGCGPEVLVGVCMRRSSGMVAALLGVLRSGAAYVPIDPAYPDARIQFILDDTTPAIVICDSSTLSRFESGYSAFNLSDDWSELSRFSVEPPGSLSQPSDSAYLIYTSGSTGQPKGVQIAHYSAVAFLTFAAKLFGADLKTGLASSSVCFDASILEIYAPLSIGGTVVVVSDVTQLLTLRSSFKDQITFIHTVPSALGELLQSPGTLDGIKTFSLGGEPLPTSLVRQLYSVPGVERIYDVYGPTETTTFSACALRKPEGVPTVGRPVDNTQIYILDVHGNPVPAGVPGELFIAGAGVSRGYWKRPELTRKRYLKDPFSLDENARMYKTGDQARFRNDGNIEILGRFDDQVKVCGFRIELGEVEHVLLQHPAVRECGCAVARSSDGVPRLVACVALSDVTPTSDSIRQFVSELLPSYMTPGNIFIRKSVPRTTSGKIDRREIAAMQDAKEPNSVRVAPKNSIEAELLKIWSDIFPGQVIGTQDNFFDLGGHSLLALRMLHKIEAVCGQRLSLSVFFHAQTIQTLATYLYPDRAFSTWKSLVPLQTTGSRPLVFLIHGSGGSLLAFKPLLACLPADQPVYGLQYFEESFDRSKPKFIEALASQFVKEIKQVQPSGPYHLVGHCAGGNIAYEMACQLAEQGEATALVGLVDAFQRPFKLRMSARLSRRANLFKEHIEVLVRNEQRFQYLSTKLKKFQREVGIGAQRLVVPEARSCPRDLEEATLFFVPRTYSGPVHLFHSHGSAAEFRDIPHDYGWSTVVGNNLVIHEMPGNHLTLLEAPHVKVLSEILNRVLVESKPGSF